MARRYDKIITALERRERVTKLCITDAERDKDSHSAALLKIRLNECQSIRGCIERGEVALL